MHKISNRIFEIFFKKTLDFLLAGFRKFLNGKDSHVSDCPLKRNTLSVATMLVADLPALIWYLAHTSACFNKATTHIQISPVGFIVNVVL